jgi:hypothetical protein
VSEDLKNWITWATKKIDWFDPLVKKEDPLLNNDYMEKLYLEI